MSERSAFLGSSQQEVEMALAGLGAECRRAVVGLLRMQEAFEGAFVAVIEEGIRLGEFRDGDPAVMAKAVIGAVSWMAVWYRPNARSAAAGTQAKRVCGELADYAVGGLTRPPRGNSDMAYDSVGC